jgi:hypothetical protein
MKKVNGIVQNSLHVFVFLVAVALELRGPSELMNTDEKKNWLIAISPISSLSQAVMMLPRSRAAADIAKTQQTLFQQKYDTVVSITTSS